MKKILLLTMLITIGIGSVSAQLKASECEDNSLGLNGNVWIELTMEQKYFLVFGFCIGMLNAEDIVYEMSEKEDSITIDDEDLINDELYIGYSPPEEWVNSIDKFYDMSEDAKLLPLAFVLDIIQRPYAYK